MQDADGHTERVVRRLSSGPESTSEWNPARFGLNRCALKRKGVPMFVTTNERGAGDGHDIVQVAPAALVASDPKAAACLNEIADVYDHHGYTVPANQLRHNVRNAEELAKPVQRHETAGGTDDDAN
jgi:hypothetical protein